jgi:hypothetical protein
VTCPNALCVADITYFPTWQGFLYVAVVVDVFCRLVDGRSPPNRAHPGCYVRLDREHKVNSHVAQRDDQCVYKTYLTIEY